MVSILSPSALLPTMREVLSIQPVLYEVRFKSSPYSEPSLSISGPSLQLDNLCEAVEPFTKYTFAQ